jgi:PAS domain S-box-containing protein
MEWFQDVLEALPDAIVVTDENGHIVLVNAQTETLFGYGRHELVGNMVEMLVPQRLRAQHIDERARYSTNPQARAIHSGLELYGLRKDGSEFPAEISLSPVKTEKGIVVSSAIRDISE